MEKPNIRRKTQVDSDTMKHQAHLEMINKELVSLKDLLVQEDESKKQLINNILILEKRNDSNLNNTISSFKDMTKEVSSFKDLISPMLSEFIENIEAKNKASKCYDCNCGLDSLGVCVCSIYPIRCSDEVDNQLIAECKIRENAKNCILSYCLY